jgi:hypothetical protein
LFPTFLCCQGGDNYEVAESDGQQGGGEDNPSEKGGNTGCGQDTFNGGSLTGCFRVGVLPWLRSLTLFSCKDSGFTITEDEVIDLIFTHMSGRVWEFRVLRTDTFTRVSSFIALDMGVKFDDVKLYAKESGVKVHALQRVSRVFGTDTSVGELCVGQYIGGGGAAGKRRKAKQQSDTAPASRVGGAGWVASSFGIAHSGL